MPCSHRQHRQDETVLSVSALWTELATSQDYRQQKIVKLFCPVSKCCVNRVLSCLDPVLNLQLGLVSKRICTTDRTVQKLFSLPICGGLLKKVLFHRQFCSHYRQNKTRQFCFVRVGGSELGIRHLRYLGKFVVFEGTIDVYGVVCPCHVVWAKPNSDAVQAVSHSEHTSYNYYGLSWWNWW